ENTVQTLLHNDVQSIEQLKQLTDEAILSFKRVGKKKLDEVKQLIEINETIDVFKYFGVNSVRPKRMGNFFNENQLYQGNILETKVGQLGRLTNNRVNAFFEYKNAVFRHEYNDTLASELQQEPAEVKEA